MAEINLRDLLDKAGLSEFEVFDVVPNNHEESISCLDLGALDGRRAWDIWQECRNLVDLTGSWPLICQKTDVLDRDAIPYKLLFNSSVEELQPPFHNSYDWIMKSDRLLMSDNSDWMIEGKDNFSRWLEFAEENFGIRPSDQDVEEVKGNDPDCYYSLLKDYRYANSWFADWLYHNVDSKTLAEKVGPPRSYLCSFNTSESISREELTIVFLPAQHTYSAALVPLYATDTSHIDGLENSGPIGLAKLLYKWNKEWDAEPVANLGTSIEFQVNRPPTDIRDALRITYEQYQIGESSISNTGSGWYYAASILNSNRWELHNKP